MAQKAQADLPRGDDRPSARGIAGHAGQRIGDAVADDRVRSRCWRGRARGSNAEERGHRQDKPSDQAFFRLWFLTGKSRIRFPVAQNTAFITAGAATEIVGSPTPPQKPPDGTTTVST